MIRQLLKRLGMALMAAGAHHKPTSAARARQRQREQTLQRKKFEQQAQNLLKRCTGKPVPAGAVRLLGMTDIKSTLGPNWDEVAGRAYDVVGQVIQRHLGPNDFFDRRDEETYILCFGEIDEPMAERVINEIVGEVKATLLEKVPEAGSIRVGHQVTKIIPEDTLVGSGCLFDKIVGALDAVRVEAENAYQHQRQMLFEESSVIYSPLWNPKTSTISMYRCMLDDATSQTTLESLRAVSDAEAVRTLIYELDLVIFSRAIEGLHALLQNNEQVPILIPINFHTLNERTGREAYVTLCRKVPVGYRKFIAFELYGISTTAPGSRILELVQDIRPYCQSVIVETTLDSAGVLRFANFGLLAVSVDLARVSGSIDDRLVKLVSAAQNIGLQIIAHGVRTRAFARSAAAAGIQFLDGEAIAPKAEKPKTVHYHVPAVGRLTSEGASSSPLRALAS